jgi:hypothetical protein
MNKLITMLAIALFAVNTKAQETKPVAKATVKKESCCTKKDTTAKKCDKKEKATCSTEEKAKCEKKSKSCCAKKA